MERHDVKRKLSETERKLREAVQDRDGLKRLSGEMGNDIKRAQETVEISRRRLDEERKNSKQIKIAQEELKTSQENLKRLEVERDNLRRGITEKDAIVQRLETERNELKGEVVGKANTIKGLEKNISDLRSSLDSIQKIRSDKE